jgi:hypothetical protein
VDDPLLKHVFQPAVNRLGVDPKAASASVARGFLVTSIALSLLIAWKDGPASYLEQLLHLVGGFILYGWMVVLARNGAVARTGQLGFLQALTRILFAFCVVMDVATLAKVAMVPEAFDGSDLLTYLVQALQDSLGLAAIYLSACDDPPPRRRRHVATRALA